MKIISQEFDLNPKRERFNIAPYLRISGGEWDEWVHLAVRAPSLHGTHFIMW